MLVAVDIKGKRTVADYDLDREVLRCCPVCRRPVILKAGRTVAAHFAHEATYGCSAAGESAIHVEAKKLLSDHLETMGYKVTLEAILSPRRRADLLVQDRDGTRFTIEIQDSPIDVDTMKRRESLDRDAGCIATCWIFTDSCVSKVRWPRAGRRHRLGVPPEIRLSDALRYRWNTTHRPLLVLRVPQRQLYGLRPSRVSRSGREWHDKRRRRRWSKRQDLHTTYTVDVRSLTFWPQRVRDRYGRPYIDFSEL
jgi:hypothetical protein